jgi:tetratricopeptide (TPR) repeat protein
LLAVKYDRNSEAIYPLLERYIDKLDEKLLWVLQDWAKAKLSRVELEQKPLMAADIGNFSKLISEFPLGNRTNNIEIAIAGYEIIANIYTRQAFPKDWANTQNNLGNAYRERLRGEQQENLEVAIACYQDALEVFSHDQFPIYWAMVQNNLGAVYNNRIKGGRGKNLEMAIAYYQAALSEYTSERSPVEWATAQYNLGIAYGDRITGERKKNLEVAIACYQTALEVYTRHCFPVDWAGTQHNLGCAYSNRITGERKKNLEVAIACYQAALQVYTRDNFPIDWARTQNNLANAYGERIKGERKENLEMAIACYQAALQVYTRDHLPLDWATTQNNLGNAYKYRIKGYRSENLEVALSCYHAALEVCTRNLFPTDWAATQNNLANAYNYRLLGKRAENLEVALSCYQAALEVYTRHDFPIQWALTQNNLGNTYTNRIKGYLRENLEIAIACYQAALEVRTREDFPIDWAMTQYNLGLLYDEQKLMSEAIQAFRSALKIWTPTTLPLNCLTASFNLGDTAFKAGNWEIAIEGYSDAIAAVEQSRTWATSESRRQEILTEAIDVYEKMVQACINDGQVEKALETVERSRSKRLVDLMASNDLYPCEILPQVKELLQQFDDLQQRIDQERSSFDSGNDRFLMGVGTSTLDRAAFQAYNEAIAALEAEKLEIWEQLRCLDPVLAGEIKVDAPNLVQMQKLIDQPTSAILSFYTTAQNLHIFILRQNQITLHTCPDKGIEPLQGWISQNWLQPYAASCHPNRPKPEQEQLRAEWISQISPFLTELAQRLQLTDLIAKHLNGIEELIVVPHLLLHQIPFAALPIQDPQYGYLGDKFLIRYTPSCQVLEFCKQRGEVTENFTYGTVEDATNDLPFASFEGEQIAQLHQICSNRRLRGSSQATRDNYRQLAEKVQVLHSCHHAESCLDEPLNSQIQQFLTPYITIDSV